MAAAGAAAGVAAEVASVAASSTFNVASPFRRLEDKAEVRTRTHATLQDDYACDGRVPKLAAPFLSLSTTCVSIFPTLSIYTYPSRSGCVGDRWGAFLLSPFLLPPGPLRPVRFFRCPTRSVSMNSCSNIFRPTSTYRSRRATPAAV